MSQTTITETLAGDTPTGVTITVTRTDTSALLATAAAMTTVGGGVYTYALTDPAPGLIYACTILFTFSDGATITRIRNVSGSVDNLPRYLQVADAMALAPSILNATAFLAATTLRQSIALAMATADLNQLRYQGRKYDLTQVNQFPRVAYEPSARVSLYSPGGDFSGQLINNAMPGAATVWDWDYVNSVPIVPQTVLLACLMQANNRLDGTQAANFDRLAAGLASQKTGGLAESYNTDVASLLKAQGGSLTISRDAMLMLEPYLLRSGRFL